MSAISFFSSEIQCGIHEPGIEFFLNPISYSKFFFAFYLCYEIKSARATCVMLNSTLIISSIANQRSTFRIRHEILRIEIKPEQARGSPYTFSGTRDWHYFSYLEGGIRDKSQRRCGIRDARCGIFATSRCGIS